MHSKNMALRFGLGRGAKMPVLFLLTLFVFTVHGAVLSARNTSDACNNSPDLCSRSYSDITHLGAHDSPFTTSSSTNSVGFLDAGNQNVNSTAQLTAGVRLLTAQVHNNNGAWHLCHSSCSLLDVGTLSSWLSEIKSWMDENPRDIVTILLVNADNASPADLSAEFTAADISTYGYVPPSIVSPPTIWPTLQDMIANNTRLVTFVTPLAGDTSSAPYLLSEFTFVFENSYNVTSATNFSCVPDRPAALQGQTAAAVQSGRLPLVNHFLYTSPGFGIQTPDTANITNTNGRTGVGSLGEAASSCTTAYGRKPAYLLVDYFNQGDALAIVDGLNGITAVGRGSVPGDATVQASSMSDGTSVLANFATWGLFSALMTIWVSGNL